VQRIEPGKPSQIKIQALPAAKQLPQDRETLYYFNLREIPPKSDKPNTLQIALQTRIKLFYRPTAIAPKQNAAPWQEQLTLTKQGDKYMVNNPTPYYVTIVDAASRKDMPGVKDFEPLMVPPKGSLPLTASAASVGGNPVLTYINDYGGRPQLSFSCSGSNCTVTPDKK
jgi:chaperone protein PapD